MPDPQLDLELAPQIPSGYVFKYPLMIVCEGLSDREFFRRFTVARNLSQFDVPFPHDPGDGSVEKQNRILGGKARFPDMLRGAKFSDIAKGVLLVIDSADNPDVAFVEAQQYIRDAGHYAIPSKLMELVIDGKDAPPVAIATMPPSEPGGLETLCYRALVRGHDEAGRCIEELCNCAGVPRWNIETQGKARLQCLIAVLNREDPNKALRYLFTKEPPLIPLTDPAFDIVEKLLRDFAQLAGVTI